MKHKRFINLFIFTACFLPEIAKAEDVGESVFSGAWGGALEKGLVGIIIGSIIGLAVYADHKRVADKAKLKKKLEEEEKRHDPKNFGKIQDVEPEKKKAKKPLVTKAFWAFIISLVAFFFAISTLPVVWAILVILSFVMIYKASKEKINKAFLVLAYILDILAIIFGIVSIWS